MKWIPISLKLIIVVTALSVAAWGQPATSPSADVDTQAHAIFTQAKAETNRDAQIALFGKIIEQYPHTYWATMSKGALRQSESIGKPFELNFTDAITGKSVSIGQFKGKIVVIDFWATWCPDCAAELPHMLELYRQYKDKGVEFIGVSLDEPESLGGLTSLKSYVKEKGIIWPQYYQGYKFDSPFSSNWGVSSTPTVFLIDQQGRLYSTTADGKLDELIPKLLSQSKS